jgi:hypothetical protein
LSICRDGESFKEFISLEMHVGVCNVGHIKFNLAISAARTVGLMFFKLCCLRAEGRYFDHLL